MRQATHPLEPLVLRYSEAAQISNVSERLLRKLVAAGALPVVRFGKCVRIPRDDLVNLCRGQKL